MNININDLNKKGIQQYINLEKYGLTTFGLKVIAVVTMLIDHIATIFLWDEPYYYQLRAIGRLSFPIFAFLIVEGFFHTSNCKKYALRMGIFALLSEIPYDIAFYPNFIYDESYKITGYRDLIYLSKQNVFITLFIGLMAIWALHSVAMGKVKYPRFVQKVAGIVNLQSALKFIIIIVACALGHLTKCTYSYAGIFLIICFYVFREYHIGKALANGFFNIMMYGGVQAYGTFSVIPIALYNGKPGKYKWKWFFYLFYPVHLIVLILIKCIK